MSQTGLFVKRFLRDFLEKHVLFLSSMKVETIVFSESDLSSKPTFAEQTLWGLIAYGISFWEIMTRTPSSQYG